MKKIILAVFVSLLILSGLFLYSQTLPSNQGVKPFVVNKGESLISISTRLEREEIIRSKWLFLIILKLKGQQSSIQAGSFKVDSDSSVDQIIVALQKGRLDLPVTILEGWRREQSALKLEQELGISASEFLSLPGAKEGYLFPDTYLFPAGVLAQKALSVIIENFEQKWQQVKKKAVNKNLSRDQIVILASLVEREARTEKDRRVVAGILVKRLQSDWPLQVDASVQYAKASSVCSLQSKCDWWPVVTGRDLEINSPYNSYQQTSLPPTPICSPSLFSLMAVADYQETDYWFYLSDLEGKTHFAKTLAEHNQNVIKYLSN